MRRVLSWLCEKGGRTINQVSKAKEQHLVVLRRFDFEERWWVGRDGIKFLLPDSKDGRLVWIDRGRHLKAELCKVFVHGPDNIWRHFGKTRLGGRFGEGS